MGTIRFMTTVAMLATAFSFYAEATAGAVSGGATTGAIAGATNAVKAPVRMPVGKVQRPANGIISRQPGSPIPPNAQTTAPNNSPSFFNSADVNGDGLISFNEMQTALPRTTPIQFRQFDVNGDGMISAQEAAAAGAARLQAMQQQNAQQLKNSLPQTNQQLNNAQQQNNQQMTNVSAQQQGNSLPINAETFNAADVDKNGILSAAELAAVSPQFPQSVFTQMDTNNDGMLSSSEWAAGMRIMAQITANGTATTTTGVAPQVPVFKNGTISPNNVNTVTGTALSLRTNVAANTVTGPTTVTTPPATVTTPPVTVTNTTANPANTATNNATTPTRTGPVFDPSMMKADVDKDGRLSFRELQTLLPRLTTTQFNKVDRSGDGFLSADELQAAVPFTPTRLNGQAVTFLEADGNRDGKVSPQELAQIAPHFRRDQFSQFDTNGDGMLSADEWTAATMR